MTIGEELLILHCDRTIGKATIQVVFHFVLITAAFSLSGCGLQHFSIAAPESPAMAPGDYYSAADYTSDVGRYTTAVAVGVTNDPAYAKQVRNDVAYGLMSQIDVVYGVYYNHLFVYQSSVAIGSDALTLGLSAASSIATHAATKTLFSALGTGIAGVGLSTQKNLFSQQAFPIIGLAMETRRDSLRTQIIQNLANDVATYPLNAAKRDLVAYLNAGTLPGGLQEIQAEAGAASAAQLAKTNTPPTTSAPTNLLAVPGPGDQQVSLAWTPVGGATSYNVYFSTKTGVTTANGTKLTPATTNSFTHSGLTDGIPYFYVVTEVSGNGESAPSAQASATPAAPAAAIAGVLPAPTNLGVVVQPSAVTLLWTSPSGATSFNLYYSATAGVTTANGTKVSGIPNPYTQSGLTPETPYYFIVTALNSAGESPASSSVTATPSAAPTAAKALVLAAH